MLTTMIDPTVRAVLVHMIESGEITIAEAAALGCVSRQAVLKWIGTTERLEGRRQAHVAARFRHYLVGYKPVSKIELRRRAKKAKRDWDWRKSNGTTATT